MARQTETRLGTVFSAAAFDVAQFLEGLEELRETGSLEAFLTITTRSGRVASAFQSTASLVILARHEVDASIAIAFADKGAKALAISAFRVFLASSVERAASMA